MPIATCGVNKKLVLIEKKKQLKETLLRRYRRVKHVGSKFIKFLFKTRSVLRIYILRIS